MASTVQQGRLTLIDLEAAHHVPTFAREVAAGLTAPSKRLPCRYFYDEAGSQLFDAICDLPEYYLTRTEREILRRCAPEIADRLPPVTLVELGSGSAAKTRLLLDAFAARQGRLRYVPVDISRSALEESARALLAEYPQLEIVGLVAEYHDGLRYLRHLRAQQAQTVRRPAPGAGRDGSAPAGDAPTEATVEAEAPAGQPAGENTREYAGQAQLILWLGSNVGNLERPEAAAFLRQVRETMSPADRLLVGIDLRKDRAILEPAYDDAQGVTARFNLNLLARINRELGGHFDLSAFEHRAIYNETAGRIEMYLVSRRAQRVRIDRLGIEVPFAAGEAIHTENSYKYSLQEIEDLASAGALRVDRQWLDAGRRFSVNLLAPV